MESPPKSIIVDCFIVYTLVLRSPSGKVSHLCPCLFRMRLCLFWRVGRVTVALPSKAEFGGGIDCNGHDPGSNLTVTVAPLSPGAALKDSATIYPTPLRGIMFFETRLSGCCNTPAIQQCPFGTGNPKAVTSTMTNVQ